MDKIEVSLNSIDKDITNKLENIDFSKITGNDSIKITKENLLTSPTKIGNKTPQNLSEADETKAYKSPLRTINDNVSVKSDRQQLFDQHLQNNIKTKTDEYSKESLLNEKLLDLKNDIKIEINDDIN